MTKHIIIAIVLICVCSALACARDYDPAVDGWNFENWGEESPYCVGSCDFSWDLYRQTYLGINPSQNCLEAPLDCAFYEIFKGCAKKGNCGGMSLLSLALYKYGGYMGFCSPASFYTGTKSPDRDDLHQAINILQARQFSVGGIENLIDVVDAGNLNNAVVAFNEVRDGLASGDYRVLSIANSAVGDLAHTVVPYRIVDGPSGGFPKKMYIWDSVRPYDDSAAHYTSSECIMTINGPHDWTYKQSDTRTYSCSGGDAWCFTVPMSAVLPKSRQPMSLDMAFDALMTIFVSGPGAAVSQVSDDQGRHLYKTDAGLHTDWSELETDKTKRLKGIVRWPWYAAASVPAPKPATGVVPKVPTVTAVSSGGDVPGELYFARRGASGSNSLSVAVVGTQYGAVIGGGRNLIHINASAAEKARDTITLSRQSLSGQSVVVETAAVGRTLSISQVREDPATHDWKSIEIKNLKTVRGAPVTIDIADDMRSFAISSRDQAITFDAEVRQRVKGQLTTKPLGHLSTSPGKFLQVAPAEVRVLQKADLDLLRGRKPVPDAVRITPAVVK